MLWRLVSFNKLKEQTEASEGGRILKPDGALIHQTEWQSSVSHSMFGQVYSFKRRHFLIVFRNAQSPLISQHTHAQASTT